MARIGSSSGRPSSERHCLATLASCQTHPTAVWSGRFLGVERCEMLVEAIVTSSVPATLKPTKPKYWLLSKLHLPANTAAKLQ